jgi:hypothetical protein
MEALGSRKKITENISNSRIELNNSDFKEQILEYI